MIDGIQMFTAVDLLIFACFFPSVDVDTNKHRRTIQKLLKSWLRFPIMTD